MAYYNNSLIQQLFPNSNQLAPMRLNSQQPRVDPQQFCSVVATLDDQSVQQLVLMARQRGISDQDIQSGLGFINQYRKK